VGTLVLALAALGITALGAVAAAAT
jgi:hypothetical protein